MSIDMVKQVLERWNSKIFRSLDSKLWTVQHKMLNGKWSLTYRANWWWFNREKMWLSKPGMSKLYSVQYWRITTFKQECLQRLNALWSVKSWSSVVSSFQALGAACKKHCLPTEVRWWAVCSDWCRQIRVATGTTWSMWPSQDQTNTMGCCLYKACDRQTGTYET